MRVRAFTLIELLIVVAIIAILAAIAVPNFLEAQTRSKVARVKADQRTIATAEEAYHVDYNSYTVNGRLNLEFDNTLRDKGGYLHMRTPVQYLTLTPVDPFGYQDVGTRRWPASYWLKAGKDGVAYAGFDIPETELWKGFKTDIYFISSAGPDKINIIDANNDPPGMGVFTGNKLKDYPIGTGWGGSGVLGDSTVTDLYVNNIQDIFYDPTNGTVSFGEIFRAGGQPGYTRTLQKFTKLAR